MPSSDSITISTIMDNDKQSADAEPKATGTPNVTRRSRNKSWIRQTASKLRTTLCLPGPETPPKADMADGQEKSAGLEKKDASTKVDNEASPSESMKCEFKFLDRKINSEGKPSYVEHEKAATEQTENKDWWRMSACTIVRRYDEDGDSCGTYLHVNPQRLRQLLKDVIGDYPSDPIDVDDTQISAPYHSLFHYRNEIEAVGLKRFEQDGDKESLDYLRLLLDWIKSNFELEIAAHDRCLSSESKAVSYENMWVLYRPGTLIHSKVRGEHRAFRVVDYWYNEDEDDPNFFISARFVDFDGESFGERRTGLQLPKFSGTREVKSHSVRPLDFVDDADELRQQLTARGKRWGELASGQHFMEYKGIAMKENPRSPPGPSHLRFDATGRIMIDCRTFHRIDADEAFSVTPFVEEDRREGKLTDTDQLLTNSSVRGYSMAAKMFVELTVDKITPITWNTKCFEELVLDSTTKKTVQALVSTHSKQKADDGFDDIVKGKGQGLVCVLHGPPGVGKTLTAECVAEYVQRPLFMVSSGDLGVSSAQLDKNLTSIMDMTSTWRAVLLIDEADVFLEERALHDLHRNSMVSVFLRVLEYYSGILFLTTNRVATFDDAFKSRIHIPIRYTDLSEASRLKIWRNFLSKVPSGVEIAEREYRILAEHDLNGRQIKNVIKAAESLAQFDGVKLDFKQLQQVTKILATFEKDLTSFGEIDYTSPGSSKKDVESRNMYS